MPATTWSPGSFGTGRDSPVIIDSSTSAAPSTTSPSAGTRRARADEHDVADRKRRRAATVSMPLVRDPLGAVRQQLGEGGERAARLGDRAHLEPVAEQHDRDQRRELPPDLDLEQAQRACPARR